jgi:glycolate oxidase FAD binding subunit
MTTIRPSTMAELAGAVEDAKAAKTPLELIGTGTKRMIGRPMQTGATLDLSAFSDVALYEPDELVITAGAGAKLDDINALLDEKGQAFAFEPPDLSRLLGSAHAGSLGGMLATNLSGPRRIKAGACRDHVLGITGVTGRGDEFKAGGRVVKNVTGYDLPRLMANSHGTLAALTALTFKVLPKAETEETLVIEGLSDADAIKAMSLAMQSSCEVAGAAHLPARIAGGTARTLLRLEGVGPSVAYRREMLAKLLASFGTQSLLAREQSMAQWIAIRDAHPFAAPSHRLVWRLSVPPSEGPSVTARIAQKIDARWFYDWAGGLVWLDVPSSDDASASIVRGAFTNGHATLIRAPDHVRANIPVFHPQEPALAALAARVKHSFDPLGLFNPGRMVAGGGA